MAHNGEKFQVFSRVYTDSLIKAVTKNPEMYFLPRGETPESGARRTAAKVLGTVEVTPYQVNYSGNGFKLACKELGIKFTRKAIFEYLEIV